MSRRGLALLFRRADGCASSLSALGLREPAVDNR